MQFAVCSLQMPLATAAEREQEQRDDDAVSMCSNETPVEGPFLVTDSSACPSAGAGAPQLHLVLTLLTLMTLTARETVQLSNPALLPSTGLAAVCRIPSSALLASLMKPCVPAHPRREVHEFLARHRDTIPTASPLLSSLTSLTPH
ncbi:hypothetical protein CKAH01_08804 [Colletotrichum kahawae]|uniref:Uncharacterized protein n=1 Tax=Colletotrichum kahawae TaxID=34407 RepID=A0AAD9Y1N7_COLKA|nr:hypothetical protein CKAH01_08804 [Colletotrichum kahawae]